MSSLETFAQLFSNYSASYFCPLLVLHALHECTLSAIFSSFFYLSWDLTGKTKELRGIRQFFRLREILLVFSCLEAYFEIFLSPIMYRSSFDYSNVCCLKRFQLYGFVFAS